MFKKKTKTTKNRKGKQKREREGEESCASLAARASSHYAGATLVVGDITANCHPQKRNTE